MNVTVNRAEFLAAAKRAASVAPLSSPLEPLRGILLETDRREGCLTISATNLEVSLVQTIPCTSLDADALVLNARLLEGMLDKLEGDSVTLIRVEQQPVVLLTSGLAAYRIGVWERGIFPQIESPYPADTVLVTGIPAMTKRTIFAVGEKKNTPLLRCVNLMFTPNGLKAVGSNGSCVVSAKGDSQSTGNISLLVPASSLDRGMGARHLPANRIALSGGYRPGHWNPRYDQAHYICGGREEKYAPAALRKPHVYAERPESGGQQRKLCGQREGGQPEYRQHQLACAGIFSGQAGPHV